MPSSGEVPAKSTCGQERIRADSRNASGYLVIGYVTVGAPTGYTSLVLLTLVLSGFTIISLGVVGLYVGRVFEQVKQRPLFIVDERVEGDEELLSAAPQRAERG